MKTSTTLASLGSHDDPSKEALLRVYLHKQLRCHHAVVDKATSEGLGDQRTKTTLSKGSIVSSCFSKWRSCWRRKGGDEPPKENLVEETLVDVAKREPPKSLPLVRRCDHLNYGPLIHDRDRGDIAFKDTRLSMNIRTVESAAVSPLTSSPPPLPLRQSLQTPSAPGCCSRLPKNGPLIENFKKLKKVPWYWGPLTKYEAEQLLQGKENGVFLVRDSGHEAYVLSVSFRASQRTYHTRVEHSSGKFSFWLNDRNAVRAANIVDFINQLIAESKTGHIRYLITESQPNSQVLDRHQLTDPGLVSVALLSPFSRFKTVQSLAHLCRFQILLSIRRDHIAQLRIPHFLKMYLQSPQYFVERIEDFL